MRHLRLPILACLLACLCLAPAGAQVTRDEAQHTLDVLQDPAKRDQLITTLKTIAQAEPQPASSATVAPNSLGAEVLVNASGFLSRLSAQAIATFGAIRSIPLLWIWLKGIATDSWAHGVLLDSGWRLVLVLLLGLVVQWGLSRAVNRPILALIRHAPNGNHAVEEEDVEARAERGETEPPHRRRLAALTLLRRIPLVLTRLFLELVPVFGFLAVTHLLAATSLGGTDVTRLVLLAVIDAYALCSALLCVARMMFSPAARRLRLLAIRDDTAGYAMRWSRRIIVVGVFGYAAAEVGLLLGMSDTAHDGLLKAVALVNHVLLGIVVVQKRRPVGAWLRAPQGTTGLLAVLRNWLAGVWHWLALMLLAGLWLGWVLEAPNGYAEMLRYFFSIVAVAIATRFLLILLLGALDRALVLNPETMARYPGLQTRIALYHPVLVSTVRVLVLILAAMALLQLWGLGAFNWLFASMLGQHLVSTLVTLVITTLIAIAVWEAVNSAIERHLARLTRDAQSARSARLRTLLPLLRTTLMITILIVGGMMVLSEVGVNIGPLLAGAGIVGVAVGFGSQKLVQDLITGVFLLLENAMQVGDSVTVSGLAGTVENLSVRTIRLRAADGSVHIIPFSSVTTVTNVNRGLGNASVNVCVAASEDTDRVADVLKEIVAGLRADNEFAPRMLSDLQLWGVDKLDGASVTIAGQVVCTDSGRWNVQREFNRRMKQRFQELGIRLYNPMQYVINMQQISDKTAE
ncbi:MAG TPA: mechanosensitive ion channel domain-containing protein [Acetobacteraceae bacterium]|nr:mechanosensitive ion channel domain-containing protein [Acetobacteraceae bacterium]